eukprot:TRINITY_DN40033_c0_g1_i1.p1 TRINITY_DN40033_c0_g1~~TRINITY_DN40033_c0_g1_i1.p1  ORF type:complete len:595 (-),score=150.84 TRINITY_DN40033_c0_g1_i1:158-1942(-)
MAVFQFAIISSLHFAGLCGIAEGLAALRGNGGFVAAMGHMNADELRATVMAEVMGALGNGNRVIEKRLQNIETVLSPMFAALPKNEYGNLDHATARYALHRLFEQRHAMYIKGLEPGGEGFSSGDASASTQVLEDRVPAFVQSLFEERLKGKGLGLHELSVLGATLEHLIHDEAVERLQVAYSAHNLSVDERIHEQTFGQVVDTYMMFFIMGSNSSDLTEKKVSIMQASIAEAYPGWHDTQKFVEQVRSGVLASKSAEPDFAAGNLSFRAASEVVEEIGERYGRWQNAECKDLKSALLKLEDGTSGRVLLKDFYNQALSEGAWQFTESLEYLRELGALDETDPRGSSVVIPNYVNSRSNCLASSSIYSVCCQNECESLLGHLEQEVAAPEAAPEQIAGLIAKLPSATVSAPRELPAELVSRLKEVADQHGGVVPLHGRLFAQWLHHAYPRECPFPHQAGSTNPMTASEWMAERGVDPIASVAAMESHCKADEAPQTEPIQQQTQQQEEKKPPPAAALPWTLKEELVVPKEKKTEKQDSFFSTSSILRTIFFSLAAVSVCSSMKGSVASGLAALSGSSKSWEQPLLPYSSKHHYC